MSQVIEMNMVFEEPDEVIRKQIVSHLRRKIPEFISSDWGRGKGEGDVSILVPDIYSETNKSLFFIVIGGGDGGYFYEYVRTLLNSEFKCNYFSSLYIEGEGIYVSIKYNGVSLFEIPLDIDDPDELFEILESEHYMERVREAFIERYFR